MKQVGWWCDHTHESPIIQVNEDTKQLLYKGSSHVERATTLGGPGTGGLVDRNVAMPNNFGKQFADRVDPTTRRPPCPLIVPVYIEEEPHGTTDPNAGTGPG